MGWAEIRDALQAAAAAASGLPSTSVFWEYQDIGQPALDYVTMSLGVATEIGIDGVLYSTDLARPAGQEIQRAIIGVREVAWQLQIFSASTVASNPSPSKDDALARAETLRSSLRLLSIREPLAAVGVSPFDPGPISYLPEIVATGFRGRATMDVRCYVPAPAIAEYTGYVATVSGTATITGGYQSPKSVPFSGP